MQRVVMPELLDRLPSRDPAAVRSRRDLRRVNAWMGNRRMLRSEILAHLAARPPASMADLGAGDGSFARGLLCALPDLAPGGELWLVDKVQPGPETFAFPARWKIHRVQADVFAWLRERRDRLDLVVANLFIHHFGDAQIQELFRSLGTCARTFICVEPRRNSFAEFFARLLWVIGCNHVTRHDARVSVRAGFSRQELSRLWSNRNFELHERRAGAFSHLFRASMKG